MMELPTEKIPATSKSPKRLFIYGPPKCGKTTAISLLENLLLIDLEKGSSFVEAMKVQVNNIDELREVITAVHKNNYPYKYGVIDTTTKLQDMVLPLAANLYRDTPMGSNWGRLKDGETPDPNADILTLPKGGGYLYLRKAFMRIINALDECFERVIYTGHLKDTLLEKEGKEVSVTDIDLSGKIKNIICANSDAVGYMYRSENKTILSFNTAKSIICGARPPHLRNKDIEIVEYDEEKHKFTSYWDRVYVD